MKDPESISRNNNLPSAGDQLQDKGGHFYIISHIDENGLTIRPIDEPLNIQGISIGDIGPNGKFTVLIHEEKAGITEDEVIYQDPRCPKGIVKSTKRAASAVLYN